MALDWKEIQEKWQNAWEKAELGKATIQKKKDKFFMIFAYPGISGYLHVGHMRGFSYTDAVCRYERLRGKEVLFPVGTHASGNQAIAFANKVKNGDTEWIDYLLRNGCPKNKVQELGEVKNVIAYFNKTYVEEYWKKFGFLCDWDRFTCTVYPDYEKFIQWQFQKLQKKNLLVQKPYFATACIKCGPVAVDPSETDISKGGNAEKIEYTLLKFKYGDEYLVAATLRPETMFGQTNLWINPRAKYVRVEVEGEPWILSEEAAEKLRFQKENVLLKEDIDPLKLIGKLAFAPGIERDILILPAQFCDPKIGTGIVTSVPSDAPYDYLALKLLQQNPEECKKYGLLPADIKEITPIPIITTQGYSELPAKDVIDGLEIKAFDDPRLEEENSKVYKAGHHVGILKENCGPYVGKKAEEAKELIKAALLEQGKGDVFHDLSEEVLCRCGSKVVIKKIDDQWFIRYSDPELTERSKEQAKEMSIYPEEYYDNLPAVLDWFQDRACARLGNWLGSKLPFDPQWTIEPISDSTLYPAYYIVSKFVHNGTLKAEDLTEEFFDYVFLGAGSATGADKEKSGADKEKRATDKERWKPIKEEFDYFYPLDINLGGKEHKTVHFPVFLMNHVAILPEEKWPRSIFVNWWVTGRGSKISKSKGGAEPIPDAIQKYGVDAMRLYYAHIGSPHVDVVWTEETVLHYKNALERVYALVEEVRVLDGPRKGIDVWLLSRVYRHLKDIAKVMEEYDMRELASHVYFGLYDDLRWYVRRGGENKKTIAEYLNVWTRLMNPITPHLSEELYQEKNLASMASWPEIEPEKISLRAEAAEDILKETMEGMRNVVKLAKLEKPRKFTLFVAEPWLYELFEILAKEIQVTRNVGEVMKKVLEIESFKPKGKNVSRIVTMVLKDPTKLPKMVLSTEEERELMKEAADFLGKEFSCKVEVIAADESTHPKATAALPGKVGIQVE